MSFSSNSLPCCPTCTPICCSLFYTLWLVYAFEVHLPILNYSIRILHTCHNRCSQKSFGMKMQNKVWKCHWRTPSFFVKTAQEKQQLCFFWHCLPSHSYRCHVWSFILHGTGRETLHLYCQHGPWPCKHCAHTARAASADEARQSHWPSMTNYHCSTSSFHDGVPGTNQQFSSWHPLQFNHHR